MIEVILHRILIDRIEPEDTDAVVTKKEMHRLGLQIPHSIKEELDKRAQREAASMDKGVVVAIGPTAFKDYGIECPIKVGDFICYARFGGKDVTDPKTEKVFVVINDEDVVCILNNEEEPVDG